MAGVERGPYNIIENHSVAPYSFASLPVRSIAAYKSLNDLPGHNSINQELMSGYIEYEIVNHTPLIIGKGKTDSQSNDVYPFKNAFGQYVIPGNTIRGMVRTNAATLSLSNIINDIEDSRFYYRDFGKGALNKDYKKYLDIGQKMINGFPINMPRALKGGIIECIRKDDYVIHPVKEINSQNYFTIAEQYLRQAIDKDFLIRSEGKKIKFMYTEEIKELIENKDKYKIRDNDSPFERNQKDKKKKAFLRRISKKDYKPYIAKVSFDIKDMRNVCRIGESGKYSNEGYLLCSERIAGKLVHYIISADIDKSVEDIKLTGDNMRFVNYYLDDLLRTKKFNILNGIMTAARGKDYYGLPSPGEVKPVFYGEFQDRIYMGFTPYLRIPYVYSIHDGVDAGYKNNKGISFADSLFGFSNMHNDKNNNYKSRLSFEDAVCKDEAKLDNSYSVILGEPHASAYPLYLKQADTTEIKNLKNYNSDGFRIRGIKHYWIKDYVTEISDEERANQNIVSNLHPLSEGTRFKGRIYYKNLSKEELGLILWSLKPSDNAHDNIGMGRPYGFGHIEVNGIKVYSEDIKKKYTSLSENYFNDVDIKNTVDFYKKYILENYRIDVEKDAGVKDLITLKTTIVNIEQANKVRYMKIGSRNKPIGEINKNEFSDLMPLPSNDLFVNLLKEERTNNSDRSGENNNRTNRNIRNNEGNNHNNQTGRNRRENNRSRNNHSSYSDGSIGSTIRVTQNNRRNK